MLQTYEAVFNNGQVHWIDTPPNADGTLHITFIKHNEPQTERKLGFMRGEIKMPNETAHYDLSKAGEQRWGFLEGQAIIPDNIDWTDDEIAQIFDLNEKAISQNYSVNPTK